MESYLLLPMCSRARHIASAKGRDERRETLESATKLNAIVLRDMRALMFRIEELKAQGFAQNEASRLNQILMQLHISWEGLRKVKDYRTPQATRCYARIFIMLVPWIY